MTTLEPPESTADPESPLIERHHEQLRQIIDLIPFMIYVKDRHGRFLMANRATHEAYGFEYGTLPGTLQADTHFAPETVRRYQAADRRVIESGQRHDSPGSPFTRGDGEERVVDFIKVRWLDDAGQEPAVLVIGQDVTERNRTETALLQQERFATLGQLTATVSHELRNPLSSMRPSLYVLRNAVAEEDVRARAAIERIERNVGRCDRIIEQLLDFTRMTTLDIEPVELNAWLSAVLAEQWRPDGLALIERPYPAPLELSMDAERMRQAVVNVWENACHALTDPPQSGAARSGASITVTTSFQNGRYEMLFTDNGEGISAADLPRVFEPLFSTRGFGTGLGLPAVRQILEQHHGGAVVRSERGEGTQVLLWLPTQGPGARNRVPPPPDAGRER